MLVKVAHNAAVYNMLENFTCQVIDVRDTGRYFPGKCLSPFLYMGKIHAFLHSSGTIPVSSDRWKIRVNIGASSCAASLSMKAGPVDLLDLRFFSSLKIPLQVTVMLVIDGLGHRPLSGTLEVSSLV